MRRPPPTQRVPVPGGSMPTRSLVVFLACTAACSQDEGLAKARGICLAPDGVHFGAQEVRTASTRTLALTSCGGVPIDSLHVDVTRPEDGTPAPFAVEAIE